MITKRRKRNEIIVFYYIVSIITHVSFFYNDKISGEDLFLGILGFGIVAAIASMLEFDDDEEIVKR